MTLRSITALSLPFTAAALLTACAVDVPTPDDPDAQEWAPKIKTVYRNWQPPVKMPDGNPEYQTALNKNSVAKKTEAYAIADAEKNEPVEKADKSAPVPEKKSVEPAKTDVKAEPAKADAKADVKAESAKAVETKTEPAKAADVKADPAKEDAKVDVKAEPAKADAKVDVKAEPVKTEAKAEPVKADAKADVKAEPVKTDAKADAKAEPVKAEPAAEQKAQKTVAKTRMVIDESATAAEYVVKEGESLSIIAKAQYKNGNLWYILWEANKNVLKDANKIRAGVKLSIPVLKSVPVGEK